ncbi:MAG: type II toxin-antitoxin system HicA family toxin [Anaerolineae bacterium]|nr:type II toxin-antitoxin system HicA family toxin [Anaerolineae bacterium]NUQ02924.1 type II toxin-antitoxin system HicA family toxin [Anaerolineae bacterium]
MIGVPSVNPEACIKALQRAGFYISRQKGSHIQMRRDEPQPARTVPVPISRKPLPRGTLRSIIRQAGLTVDEFAALLD